MKKSDIYMIKGLLFGILMMVNDDSAFALPMGIIGGIYITLYIGHAISELKGE